MQHTGMTYLPPLLSMLGMVSLRYERYLFFCRVVKACKQRRQTFVVYTLSPYFNVMSAQRTSGATSRPP